MTDEERAALREEIEGLTIRQARQRAETATETLRVLAELGIGGPARIVTSATDPRVPAGAGYALPAPGPQRCPVCARLPGDEGECALGLECLAVARTGRGKMTNKGSVDALRNAGPVNGAIGSSPPITLEQRAAMLAAPAFGPDGEPIE